MTRILIPLPKSKIVDAIKEAEGKKVRIGWLMDDGHMGEGDLEGAEITESGDGDIGVYVKDTSDSPRFVIHADSIESIQMLN